MITWTDEALDFGFDLLVGVAFLLLARLGIEALFMAFVE